LVKSIEKEKSDKEKAEANTKEHLKTIENQERKYEQLRKENDELKTAQNPPNQEMSQAAELPANYSPLQSVAAEFPEVINKQVMVSKVPVSMSTPLQPKRVAKRVRETNVRINVHASRGNSPSKSKKKKQTERLMAESEEEISLELFEAEIGIELTSSLMTLQ